MWPRRLASWRETLASARVNIDAGWSVLLANLGMLLLISLDRIWVGATFPIRDFAIYGFAAQTLSLLYLPMNAVSKVLFPYLAEGVSDDVRSRSFATGEFILLLAWAAGMAVFFPVRWVVGQWLPKYEASMPILLIMLFGTAFFAPVTILHSSYLKVAGRQRQFLAGCVCGLAITTALLWYVTRFHRLEAAAGALVVGNAFWWAWNDVLVSEVIGHEGRRRVRLCLSFAACSVSIWFTAGAKHGILGLSLYVAFITLLFPLLWREELRQLRVPHRISMMLAKSQARA
jgi:O-antigen/teichoic acid export membrane protein